VRLKNAAGIEERAASLVRRYTPRLVREHLRDSQARLADLRHNRRVSGSDGRILVVRHLHHTHRFYNDDFLAWAAERAPGFARRLELRRLPCRITRWERYALLVPWLQDPLREQSPVEYRQARRLEVECEQRGIPVVNPVDTLSVSVKSVATERLAAAGVRTPRMVPITDVSAFRRQPPFDPPFFVREDRRHGGPMLLVQSLDQVRGLPLEGMEWPVAVEFIDVGGADGLYRKYRHGLFGDRGVPHHLLVSRNWVVHYRDRVVTEATKAEELRYVSLDRDPNHEVFLRGRRALGLDSVAFDYAYDQEGALVVFEANPFPVWWTLQESRELEDDMSFSRDRLYSELVGYLTERAENEPLVTPSPPA
jgi:hypothetical protein